MTTSNYPKTVTIHGSGGDAEYCSLVPTLSRIALWDSWNLKRWRNISLVAFGQPRTTGRWWCVSSALLRHSAGDRRERGPHRADTRSPRGRCWLISTLAPSHPRRAGNVASRRGRSAPFALLPRTALARRASFMEKWLSGLRYTPGKRA